MELEKFLELEDSLELETSSSYAHRRKGRPPIRGLVRANINLTEDLLGRLDRMPGRSRSSKIRELIIRYTEGRS